MLGEECACRRLSSGVLENGATGGRMQEERMQECNEQLGVTQE